ncbi:MAG TPA: hypothetical protein VIV65_09250 [Gemmatimonadaceae bacterium]
MRGSARRSARLRYPQFLPDGRHFVYIVRSGRPEESGAYLGSIKPTVVRINWQEALKRK